MRAHVIVLAGPSGAGKSRLAERLGLPVLRLDDFYKQGDDPTLPRITDGANAGLVDWDHTDSWNRTAALAAIAELCWTGHTDVPVYDISSSRTTGTQALGLAGGTAFVAEGIFAQDIVEECRDRDFLGRAVCVTQHPLLTFVRRLRRDLAERRKPPLVLLRRGWHLMRDQRRIVDAARAAGCQVLTSDEAHAELSRRYARGPAE
ncbi:ATP-binding protein [Nocardioides sp.]|uniref:ATP-binding protein n=1 Tax=Nocardioides sp. TaxID=35761 RepID=UPI00261BE685|nr:ATP-binding protein [Nocardioides sp.]